MKKHALTFVGVLSLLLAAGSALAQTQKIRADVPFNFTVNRATLPAGQYTISNLGRGNSTLLLQSEDGKTVRMVNSNRAESLNAADQTKLIFHCYGRDHCFLYQAWVGGMNHGVELPRGSIEKELAANLGSRDTSVMASIAK